MLYQKNGTLSTGPPPKYFTPEIVQVSWFFKILTLQFLPLVVARMLPYGRPFLSFLPEVRGLKERKKNWKKEEIKLIISGKIITSSLFPFPTSFITEAKTISSLFGFLPDSLIRWGLNLHLSSQRSNSKALNHFHRCFLHLMQRERASKFCLPGPGFHLR